MGILLDPSQKLDSDLVDKN